MTAVSYQPEFVKYAAFVVWDLLLNASVVNDWSTNNQTPTAGIISNVQSVCAMMTELAHSGMNAIYASTGSDAQPQAPWMARVR